MTGRLGPPYGGGELLVTARAAKATLKPRSKYAGEALRVLYLGGGVRLGSDTAAVKGGKKH